MKYLIIIGIILIQFGCTPLSKIGIENCNIESIEKCDFSVLNGIYKNQHDTAVGELKHSPGNGFDELERLSILNQLFLSVPESAWRDSLGTIIEHDKKFIQIEFIDSKKAYVSLHHNNDLIFTKKIRGKFKNGYFYLRPKGVIIPLIPLIFGYNFQRTRIGKSGDYLLIDYTVNRWGFALVAGSSDKGYASSRYKVIKRK